MPKRQIRPNRPIYPTPTALITSVDEDGNPNIITLAEVFNISIAKPVIIGIAIRKATYSHSLISKTKEYVVNMPTVDLIDKVLACGSVSGRDVDLTDLPLTSANFGLLVKKLKRFEINLTLSDSTVA